MEAIRDHACIAADYFGSKDIGSIYGLMLRAWGVGAPNGVGANLGLPLDNPPRNKGRNSARPKISQTRLEPSKLFRQAGANDAAHTSLRTIQRLLSMRSRPLW